MPDICSVNYTADPAIEPDEAVQESRLQASLQNLLPRPEPYEILVKGVYRVHQRVAAAYRSGRVFLAGDAAHLNNPLGGMGLNGGLQDVLSLVPRLAAVWHGTRPDAELDGYEAQRRPEAVHAINAITARNKKLMEERDPVVRQRNLRQMAEIAADPKRAYDYMLEASMITSLRRCGMIR